MYEINNHIRLGAGKVNFNGKEIHKIHFNTHHIIIASDGNILVNIELLWNRFSVVYNGFNTESDKEYQQLNLINFGKLMEKISSY